MAVKKLPENVYKYIYSRVPRIAVEVIYVNKKGLLLTLRDFGPWKDQWHFPGGSILWGESMFDTAKRVAKEELGVIAEPKEFLGIIEWLPITNIGRVHSYSVCVLVDLKSEDIKLDRQARDFQFFKKLPENTIVEQKNFALQKLCLEI